MDDDHDGTISLAELEKTMIKIKDLIENEKTNSLDCEKVSESFKNKEFHIQYESLKYTCIYDYNKFFNF